MFAGADVRREPLPLSLLSCPISATWAANHTKYWSDKAFAGFLFSGIQDNLETDLWAVDGDPATKENEDGLVREVRLANERLQEAGINHNFVNVPLLPERAFFADPAAAATAIQRLKDVGTFCRITGLQGIAFDTRPAALIWDYRWDGYSYANYEAGNVAQGAYAFGRRAGQAVLRECPQAEILVMTTGTATWTALWMAFFEGILQAVQASPNATLHLLTAESCNETDPTSLALIADRTRHTLSERLSAKSNTIWRNRGAVDLGLSPLRNDSQQGSIPQSPIETIPIDPFVSSLLGFNDGTPSPPTPSTGLATYPFGTFRLQAAMAKLLSDTYVWVDDPGAAWWRVSEQDAATYGPLLQNGTATRTQVGLLSPELDAYTMRMPFDAFRRVGPYETEQGPCYVLANEKGAGLFFWNGLTAAFPVTENTDIIAASLFNDKSQNTPLRRNTATVAPRPDAVFIYPLPVRRWVLPASLWMDMPSAPSPTADAVPIRFGVANRLGLVLSGSLDTIPPEGGSIKPATTSFSLDPGADFPVEGLLRGRFPLGTTITPNLAITLPGNAPIHRRFSFAVEPNIAWKHWFDGAVTNISRVPTSSGPVVIACSDAGEIAGFNAEGSLQWKQRISGGFTGIPCAALDAAGTVRVAVHDANGSIRVFAADQGLLWERPFRDLLHAEYVRLDNAPGADTLLVLTAKALLTLDEDGEELWHSEMDDPNTRMTVETASSGSCHRAWVTSENVDGAFLRCVDRNGWPVWQASLANTPSLPPIVSDLTGDGSDEVLALSIQGDIQIWDAASGDTIAELKTSMAGNITGATVDVQQRLLITEPNGVHCVALDSGETAWSVAMPVSGVPAVIMKERTAESILVMSQNPQTAQGILVCIDANGQIRWQDTRPTTPFTSNLAVDSPITLYATRDHALVCLALP